MSNVIPFKSAPKPEAEPYERAWSCFCGSDCFHWIIETNMLRCVVCGSLVGTVEQHPPKLDWD